MVKTSRDIGIGHHLQRYAPWACDRAMRGLNAKFSQIIAQAGAAPRATTQP